MQSIVVWMSSSLISVSIRVLQRHYLIHFLEYHEDVIVVRTAVADKKNFASLAIKDNLFIFIDQLKDVMRQAFPRKQHSFHPFVVSLIDSRRMELENLFVNRFASQTKALVRLRCTDV